MNTLLHVKDQYIPLSAVKRILDPGPTTASLIVDYIDGDRDTWDFPSLEEKKKILAQLELLRMATRATAL